MSNQIPLTASERQGPAITIPPVRVGAQILPPGPWAERVIEIAYNRSRVGGRGRTEALRALQRLPAQRELSWRPHRTWSGNTEHSMIQESIHNMEAALVQIVGDVRANGCVSCQSHHGPWAHCVTVTDVPGIQCCANCHFRNQDSRCRFESPPPMAMYQPAFDNTGITITDHQFQQPPGRRQSPHGDTDSADDYQPQEGLERDQRPRRPDDNRMITLRVNQDELAQARDTIGIASRVVQRTSLAIPLVREEMRASLNAAFVLEDYLIEAYERDPTNSQLRRISNTVQSLVIHLEALSIYQNNLLEGTRAEDGSGITFDQARLDAGNSILDMLDRAVIAARWCE